MYPSGGWGGVTIGGRRGGWLVSYSLVVSSTKTNTGSINLIFNKKEIANNLIVTTYIVNSSKSVTLIFSCIFRKIY